MSTDKYKNTLNIFQTDFPIRANLKETEEKIQEKWNKIDIISIIKNLKKNNKKFILHDGPPYANGNIHLGHSYNKSLKDIVIKSRLMFGYNSNCTPGWDCHGLPIEQKVSAANPNLSPAETKVECRKYANHWINEQKNQFKKLGIFMDWNNPYTTMDYSYEAETVNAFAKMVEKGFIFRDRKTIPWCSTCKTALATAEIEYQDRKDPSVYVLFEIINNLEIFKSIVNNESIYCLIWTTTPWTLPLNRGVMLKTSGKYSLVKSNDKFLIIGEKCIDYLKNVTSFEYEILKTFDSKELENTLLNHPFEENKKIKFVYDESVEDKEGTACVHTAPGCGPLDYEIGVKNDLEIYSPISDDGKYTEDIYPKELIGMPVSDGQWWVLKKLQENGKLWFKGSIKHSYPHCWRSKDGLIFRATPQWFFNLEKDNFKDKVLKEIEKIRFFPSVGKTFLIATVSNRWEWCLSRQRVWGTPIPAILLENGKKYWTSAEFIRSIANKIKENGIEYWDTVSKEDLIKYHGIPKEYSINDFEKENNILDVWFDSGVSHTAVLKQSDNFPADMYLEGIDQHRGWFQSSVITSVLLNDTAPMKQIVSHGFTIDEKGIKMSKSIGNVIEPEEVIKKIGIDGLRLWVSSISNEGDVVLSQKVIDNLSEVYRKIRNTCRFIIQNIADFNYEKDVIDINSIEALDLYALKKMYEISLKAMNSYYKIQFPQIYHLMADFCSVYLSSFYFDISKDVLYCDEKNSKKRRSAQTAMYIILDTINRIMAPITSHTSEQIYEFYCNKKESIFLDGFYKFEYLKDLGDFYNISTELLTEELIENKLLEMKKDNINSYNNLWNVANDLRDKVMKEIENLREKNIVKQSIETMIEIKIPNNWNNISDFNNFKKLFNEDSFEKEFARICMVSDLKIKYDESINDLIIIANKHDGNKCERCWFYSYSKTDLCDRCIKTI